MEVEIQKKMSAETTFGNLKQGELFTVKFANARDIHLKVCVPQIGMTCNMSVNLRTNVVDYMADALPVVRYKQVLPWQVEEA